MREDDGMVLEVVQLGNPRLRSHAHSIPNPTAPGIQQLIEQLVTTLTEKAGVGIAAPQVGQNIQLIIVASRPTLRYPEAPTMDPLVMINPQLLTLSIQREKDWEGCLSVPGIRGLVPRHQRITVAYLDRQGQPQQQTFTGFIARIVQHEYDHLQGKVFLDRVESTLDLMTESEYLQQVLPGVAAH